MASGALIMGREMGENKELTCFFFRIHHFLVFDSKNSYSKGGDFAKMSLTQHICCLGGFESDLQALLTQVFTKSHLV